MITGFNTDVKYRGVVYHVQTEDKGTANPLIETLIYKGGEILGSRRLPYADLAKARDDEATITRLMEVRVTSICAGPARSTPVTPTVSQARPVFIAE